MDIASKIVESMPMEPKEDEGSMSAAEDILSAVKSDDAKALDTALKAHYTMCKE